MVWNNRLDSGTWDSIESFYQMGLWWSKKIIIFSLNVNDILLVSNDTEMIVATKWWLSFNFEMKDMGQLDYILGVKIFRDRSKKLLGLSQ